MLLAVSVGRCVRAVVLALVIGLPGVAGQTARAAELLTAPEIEQAVRLHASGQPGKALHLLEQFLVEHPDNTRALFLAGFIHNQFGETELAIARLERVVALEVNRFFAWELLAQLYQEKGEMGSRDGAVANVRRIYRTTTNPTIRRKTFFIRENLMFDRRVYVVARRSIPVKPASTAMSSFRFPS